MIELFEAERRVAECIALIERQSQLIEESIHEGHDITSLQIVFDSLLISLSLHVQERHRLRYMLNVKAAEAEVRMTEFLQPASAHWVCSTDNR